VVLLEWLLGGAGKLLKYPPGATEWKDGGGELRIDVWEETEGARWEEAAEVGVPEL
jgi:hypothetical protein